MSDAPDRKQTVDFIGKKLNSESVNRSDFQVIKMFHTNGLFLPWEQILQRITFN
jgi:hypothetical protein